MDFSWKSEYEELASQFLKQHFGSAQGLTNCFPCMRDDYPWASHRPDVIDSRVPAKNNTEYHGLEKHAAQYHATAQYDYAYHHWLMAASWRRQDMLANNFNDNSHKKQLNIASSKLCTIERYTLGRRIQTAKCYQSRLISD